MLFVKILAMSGAAFILVGYRSCCYKYESTLQFGSGRVYIGPRGMLNWDLLVKRTACHRLLADCINIIANETALNAILSSFK